MEKAITHTLSQVRNIGSKIASYPSLMIWIVIVIILLATPLFSAGFLDPTHLLNVARKASGLGIVAVGQTYVINHGRYGDIGSVDI